MHQEGDSDDCKNKIYDCRLHETARQESFIYYATCNDHTYDNQQEPKRGAIGMFDRETGEGHEVPVSNTFSSIKDLPGQGFQECL